MSEEKMIEKPKICPLLYTSPHEFFDNLEKQYCLKDRCAWFKNGECAITHIAYLPKW